MVMASGRFLRFFVSSLYLLILCSSATSQAKTVTGGDYVALQKLELKVPEGWQLWQNAADDGKIILGFTKSSLAHDYVNLFVKKDNEANLDKLLPLVANAAKTNQQPEVASFNGNEWTLRVSSHTISLTAETKFTVAFVLNKEGYSYFGYSSADTEKHAQQNVELFLASLK